MNPTELRLLGLLLDHVLAADLVADVTHGSEFASPTLGGIFDRILAVRARGEAIDAETLPSFFVRWGVPVPEDVPDPVLWSKHDALGTARELAHVVHAEHLRRQAAAIIATARPALADRAIDPLSTLTSLRRDVDELIDSSRAEEDDGAMLLADILAMDVEYDWVVPGLLERQDRLVVTGPEGSGKSVLVRQLAVCASAGLHPFDFSQHDPQSVLVVDVENTRRQWQRKAGTVAARAAQLGRRDPRQHLVVINRGRLDLTSAEHEALVHRWVDRYKPDILVIGPLYKMVPRAITNDDDAAPLITALDGFRDRGLTLIMEAHAGKATEVGGERAMAPRGSSALLGWPEFGFGVRPMIEDANVSQVVKWRGDRDERAWPKFLRRDAVTQVLPWEITEHP